MKYSTQIDRSKLNTINRTNLKYWIRSCNTHKDQTQYISNNQGAITKAFELGIADLETFSLALKLLSLVIHKLTSKFDLGAWISALKFASESNSKKSSKETCLANYYLGHLYTLNNDYSLAKKSYVKCINSAWFLEDTSKILANASLGLANIFHSKNEYELSAIQLERVQEMTGVYETDSKHLLTSHIAHGIILAANNKYTSAAKHLRSKKFLSSKKTDPEYKFAALINLAYIQIATGDASQGLKYLSRAKRIVNLHPNSSNQSNLYFLYAIAFIQLDNFSKAESYLHRCIFSATQHRPDIRHLSYLYQLMGKIKIRLNKPKEGQEFLDKANLLAENNS